MVFHNFDELIAHVKGQPSRARMAVAAAGDAHTIEAVLRARAEGIVTPILVGDKAVIDQVLAELGEHIPAEDIHDEPDLAEAARKAVALVRAGEADFLMKGKLDTSVLLKAVVNKETGLGKPHPSRHHRFYKTARLSAAPGSRPPPGRSYQRPCSPQNRPHRIPGK